MSRFVFTLALIASVPVAALPLSAMAENALPPGITSATLLPGWQDSTGTRIAAIKLDLAPGWKTYWRVPGEAGIAPAIDFSASRNLGTAQIVWPTPQAFDQDGMRSMGYRGTVIWPLRLMPEDTAIPVSLVADLDLGLCHDICVPARLHLEETLTGTGSPDAAITAALADIPKPVTDIARCTITPTKDGMTVTARIALAGTDLAGTDTAPTAFELRSKPMWTSEAQEHREGDILIASSDFVPADARPFDLDANDLLITVLDPAGAIEIDGCPAATP